jgi:hypothetical protein
MGQKSRIIYGFSDKALQQFDEEFESSTLEWLKGRWRSAKLRAERDGRVEEWRISHSKQDLEEAARGLGGNAEAQAALLRRAVPILAVNILPKVVEIAPELHGKDDFTFYLERYLENDQVEELLRLTQQRNSLASSYECKLRIWDCAKWNRTNWFAEGRVLACRCFEGRYWSLTFRKHRDSGRPSAEPFLNSPKQLNDLLSPLVFGTQSIEHGLIIIAGRTGVAKSKVAVGLIKDYLSAREGARRSHLLTFEDPIEKYVYDTPREGGGENQDYTPRQRGPDADDLDQAVLDALRQTPTVMFVGETREPQQWRRLLHLAGTGHLILTTTHAGSLTETVANVLQAVEVRGPRSRSIIADRLLAVVHLRGETEEGIRFVLPALWRRTAAGTKALMAEGLSSLLPNTPPKQLKKNSRKWAKSSGRQSQVRLGPNCIGRYWFARELTAVANCPKRVKTGIERRGFEWDLEGI